MNKVKVKTIGINVSMTRAREYNSATLAINETVEIDEGEDVQAVIDTVRADLAKQVDAYTGKLIRKLVAESRKPMP